AFSLVTFSWPRKRKLPGRPGGGRKKTGMSNSKRHASTYPHPALRLFRRKRETAHQRRVTRVPHTRSCHVRRSESNHANQKPHPSSASDTSASTKREHAVRVSMREPSSRTSRNFQAREPTVAPTRTHDTTKYAPVTISSHSMSSARSSRP